MTVHTTLNGFVRRDIQREGRLQIRVDGPPAGEMPWIAAPPVKIHDARAVQTGDEAVFFDRHGFVLAPNASAVKDWDTMGEGGDIDRFYLREIEEIIRTRLLPGKRLQLLQFPNLIRRGPGTGNIYAQGVHNDYGLSADDYQESLEAFSTPEIAAGWRKGYDRSEVTGFMVINFWRTVYMKEPLRHLPLAVCDPASVAAEDVVPAALVGFSPSGKPTNQLSLHHDDGQQWYYYPEMTTGEVLAFKIFENFKGREPMLNTCFHTAFKDPNAPEDVEARQSCEHRVGVFILADNN